MTWVCWAHAPAGATSMTASVVARIRRTICMSFYPPRRHDSVLLFHGAWKSIFRARRQTLSEQLLELLDVDGPGERVVALDQPLFDQVGQRLLEGERALSTRDRRFLMQVL